MQETIKLIEKLKNTISNYSNLLSNNEQLTRYALIDPVLTHVGWDLTNPDEVIPEFTISGL